MTEKHYLTESELIDLLKKLDGEISKYHQEHKETADPYCEGFADGVYFVQSLLVQLQDENCLS